MTQEAWKYALRSTLSKENYAKARERIEREKAEAKKNITLPKLKWMEQSGKAGR